MNLMSLDGIELGQRAALTLKYGITANNSEKITNLKVHALFDPVSLFAVLDGVIMPNIWLTT